MEIWKRGGDVVQGQDPRLGHRTAARAHESVGEQALPAALGVDPVRSSRIVVGQHEPEPPVRVGDGLLAREARLAMGEVPRLEPGGRVEREAPVARVGNLARE